MSKVSHEEFQHPFGLQYFGLKLVAFILRGLSSLAQSRAKKLQLAAIPHNVTRSRIEIPSREAGRCISVDVYRRRQTKGGVDVGASDPPSAVHLNFHGSGFVVPGLGGDIAFCARLASEVDVVVLDCDYRKAPEGQSSTSLERPQCVAYICNHNKAPFPAGHNDTLDVFAYVIANPTSFAPNKISVGGFSAGANLGMALVVSDSLPKDSFTSVISFYGNPNISKPTPSPPSKTFTSGILLPDIVRRIFYASYMLPAVDQKNIGLSPFYAPVDRWPKNILITCGEADSLWVPGKELVDKLKGKGLEVEWHSVPNAAHAFDKGVMVKESAEETKQKVDNVYSQAIEMIRRS
ncbi:hypothetical protein P7C70_g6665, partial [Phenoliferia sp. Uapishka_3]